MVEAVAPWKSTVTRSPGSASPQMWIGMSRWRTMWLEKTLGRVTSACAVAARRTRVRMSFI